MSRRSESVDRCECGGALTFRGGRGRKPTVCPDCLEENHRRRARERARRVYARRGQEPGEVDL